MSKLQERSQLPSLPSNEIGAPRVQASDGGGVLAAGRPLAPVFWKSYVPEHRRQNSKLGVFFPCLFPGFEALNVPCILSFSGRSGYFGVEKNIRSGDSFAGKPRASQHLSKAMHPLGERKMPEGLSLWFLSFGA